jgi:hypothetical protein
MIRGLVKDGVMGALSAAIIPLETKPLKDANGRQRGWRITRSELVNFSFVTVPADTNCVITERSNDRAGKAISAKNAKHIAAIADAAATISDRCDALTSGDEPDPDDLDESADSRAASRRSRAAEALRLKNEEADRLAARRRQDVGGIPYRQAVAKALAAGMTLKEAEAAVRKAR